MLTLQNLVTPKLEVLRETLLWMLGEIDLELTKRAQKTATPVVPTVSQKKRKRSYYLPSIVEQLRDYYTKSGKSLDEIGKELGISGTTVSTWFRGKWKPGTTTRSKILMLLEGNRVQELKAYENKSEKTTTTT